MANKKHIIIYESSSFGGCYQYALELQRAYAENPEVGSCKLYLPKNATAHGHGTYNKLLSDSTKTRHRLLLKLHFLLRLFLNPIRFAFLIRSAPASFVFLNDFEQLSAPLWAPLYKLFLRKHTFAVYLHDPDRDAYPPTPRISAYCMKRMMNLMQFAFYHETLPNKVYYQHNPHTKYISVPHGIYQTPKPEEKLLKELQQLKEKGQYIITIIGNIREEKNYRLIIEALKHTPTLRLIIAGKAANSAIDLEGIKHEALKHQTAHQVTWLTRYLSEPELSAVITVADAVMLYYKSSFTSQSAILNTVAPFKKNILVSDGPSSLAQITKRYKLGIVKEPDSLQELISGLQELQQQKGQYGWDDYMEYASWKNQVLVVLKAINSQLAQKQ